MPLVAVAREVTGLDVVFRHGTWLQDECVIVVPPGDEEGLLHEICHHLVASEEELRWPNLALDEDVAWVLSGDPACRRELRYWTPETPTIREEAACWLEHRVYAATGRAMPPSSCTGRSPGPVPGRGQRWAVRRLRERATRLGTTSDGIVRTLSEALRTFGSGWGGSRGA